MLLHEFMTLHREEILSQCHGSLEEAPGDEALAIYVVEFFDETLRAVRRDSGVPESRSPLPATSDAAARFGSERQKAGVPVTRLPMLFAAISQAVGTVGKRHDLTISAEEYRLLNACLDAGVATSIENFWRQDKEREAKLITESFGFMAHDLRNALGNANMAFKLLRGGGMDLAGRTGDVLGRNLAKMEALVAQCLASVRLQVGVTPTLVPVHVATVLRNIEASAIPDRDIAIVLLLDEQLYISADEMLLSSALSNLVHNAIKFSPPGSTIKLHAYSVGSSVVIEVEDECGGLAHHDVATLFEPYVKRNDGNRDGTGLGLSIAKRAVIALHGEIEVLDRPGHGCVFTLRFPLSSPLQR